MCECLSYDDGSMYLCEVCAGMVKECHHCGPSVMTKTPHRLSPEHTQVDHHDAPPPFNGCEGCWYEAREAERARILKILAAEAERISDQCYDCYPTEYITDAIKLITQEETHAADHD